jgi:hypothetical protein
MVDGGRGKRARARWWGPGFYLYGRRLSGEGSGLLGEVDSEPGHSTASPLAGGRRVARSALLDAWRGREMPTVPSFANTGGAWGHLAVRSPGRTWSMGAGGVRCHQPRWEGEGERNRVRGRTVITRSSVFSLQNSIFLLSLGLKRKTDEYHFCLVFRDLQLLIQALFHLSNGLWVKLKDSNTP